MLPIDPGAQVAVLHALRSHATAIPVAAATRAGAAVIHAAEVRAAMQRLPPGSAPGPDGIPIAIYRQHIAHLAPLLARVFTAIGRHRDVPHDFLLGAISFFYKKGPRTDPVNYRPITLLGADYRILARVLATRLGCVLQGVISPEQTAFLPGRRMGEIVHLLQLLPPLLRQVEREAVMAFLDFAKAYDTVDRGFLLAAMEAMGAGEGLMTWVRTLLSDTPAVAVVNGHVSLAAPYLAGVRQGCPLSPLLYLFIGEALLSWLKQCGYGIDIGGHRVVAGQFADDCTALLEDLLVVPDFNVSMHTFGCATGQYLNATKVNLMRIGKLPLLSAPLPSQASGPPLPFPVVDAATTLGIRFTNQVSDVLDMQAFWRAHLNNVYDRYTRLARLPLSAFGRAYGAGGYGISRILFHAEFMGLPPPELCDELERHTAALVDKHQAPPQRTGITGIASAGLAGPPPLGGLGLLPFKQHVRARHAWWALQLLTAPLRSAPPKAWMVVARALLQAIHPCATPLSMLTDMPVRSDPGQQGAVNALQQLYRHGLPLGKLLPSPLCRLISALHCLWPGRPGHLVGAAPLGPWCRLAPVWGNPLLFPDGSAPLEVPHAAAFAGIPTLCNLDALHSLACNAFAMVADPIVSASVCALHNAMPAAHLQFCLDPPHALVGAQLTAACWEAEAEVLRRIVLRGADGVGVPLTNIFTVRQLTHMQVDAAGEYRKPRLASFIQSVGSPTCTTITSLQHLFKRAWLLPWENARKEVLWRLAVDGVQLYGDWARLHGTAVHPSLPCICSTGTVCRLHCFWDCTLAKAMRVAIEAALPPTLQPLSRPALWVAATPRGLHAGVWLVVSLAALNSIDHGRRYLTALSLNRPIPGPDTAITDTGTTPSQGQHPPVATRGMLLRVAVSVEETFWQWLEDFVALNSTPPSTWTAVPAIHPFLCLNGGCLRVSPRPAPAARSAVP